MVYYLSDSSKKTNTYYERPSVITRVVLKDNYYTYREPKNGIP